MNKRWIAALLISTLALSSGLRAEEMIADVPTEEQNVDQGEIDEQQAAADAVTEDEQPPASEPRQVGAASTDAAQAARSRKWQNIGIAAVAVLVAATAIYLASTNGGHHAQ